MVIHDAYREEVIDPGDEASKIAKEICFESHQNCPALTVISHQPNNFRGPVGWLWKPHILKRMLKGVDDPVKHWIMLEEMENDGAGGKPQLFTLIGTPKVFGGLGREIIAMTADDFARSGRFPAIIANEANFQRITKGNFHLVRAMFEGYGRALKEAGLVNITGETAVMKHNITAFCDTGGDDQLILTWGATCIGLAHHQLLINPMFIELGMPIVGFWEPGYRCNGGTFLTNLILEKWGSPTDPEFWENGEMLEFVSRLTMPSQSYARTITRIVGWLPDGDIGRPLAEIRGVAHITGGGVWGKLGEILPKGVGALLNTMPRPAEVLLEAQRMSWGTKYPLTDRQAHRTFHGGCGMLVVCATEDDAIAVITEASKDGIIADRVGITTASNEREIIIFSQFLERKKLSSLGE